MIHFIVFFSFRIIQYFVGLPHACARMCLACSVGPWGVATMQGHLLMGPPPFVSAPHRMFDGMCTMEFSMECSMKYSMEYATCRLVVRTVSPFSSAHTTLATRPSTLGHAGDGGQSGHFTQSGHCHIRYATGHGLGSHMATCAIDPGHFTSLDSATCVCTCKLVQCARTPTHTAYTHACARARARAHKRIIVLSGMSGGPSARRICPSSVQRTRSCLWAPCAGA